VAGLGVHLAAQLPDLPTPKGEGDFPVPPSLFFVLFAVGFLIGVLGQVIRSRPMITAGLALVFLSTALFVVLSLQANQ
jgi:uncharacterized membrane protein